jgi:hypothetical protein
LLDPYVGINSDGKRPEGFIRKGRRGRRRRRRRRRRKKEEKEEEEDEQEEEVRHLYKMKMGLNFIAINVASLEGWKLS